MKEFDEEAIEEIHKRRTKRGIKVAIIESVMVIAVILTVIITTMLVTGYNVKPGDNWTIERSGLVQILSLPTGANVTIDGDTIFGWTNMSRAMSEGDHEIVLSRDGYEDWRKTVSVTAGLYHRLSYPRLFLKEKKVETFDTIPEGGKVSFGKDGNTALVYFDDQTTWRIVEINNDMPKFRELDLKNLFPKVEDNSEVKIAAWSGDNERILISRGEDWFILNLKKPEASLNLEKKFGIQFSEVRIANDSASVLYAISDENLRRINVNDEEMSSILVSNVKTFDNLKLDLAYIADDDEDGEYEYGFLKDGGEKVSTDIYWHKSADGTGIDVDDEKVDSSVFLSADHIQKIQVSEYYGTYYLSLISDQNEWAIFEADKFFGSGTKFKFVSLKEYGEEALNFLDVRGDGGLLVLEADNFIDIFDIETENVVKITTFLDAGWLDEHMIFDISEAGELVVADFDRQNEHKMADSAAFGTEVKISKNNRYLYFTSIDNKLSRIIIAD